MSSEWSLTVTRGFFSQLSWQEKRGIHLKILYFFGSVCILNVTSWCKFCKNRFFNTFFPLSHTFYFETRPSPLSKIGENAFGAHFLQLYRNEFNKDSASFRWEKDWHKSMFSFLAVLLNCTEWAITGRIVRVQFNSTLERKIKTGALKGILSG